MIIFKNLPVFLTLSLVLGNLFKLGNKFIYSVSDWGDDPKSEG